MNRHFRATGLASALAWALGALALTACDGTGPGPLRLEMAIDKSTVALDDSVRVSLTLTNTGIRPVMVYPANAYGICFRAFEVFDAQSRQVSPWEGLCATLLSLVAPQPVELGIGEQIAIADWWHPARSVVEGNPIGPGIYRVRGRAAADNQLLRTAPRQVLLQQ